MEADNRWVGIRVWLGLRFQPKQSTQYRNLACSFENILFRFSTRDLRSSLTNRDYPIFSIPNFPVSPHEFPVRKSSNLKYTTLTRNITITIPSNSEITEINPSSPKQPTALCPLQNLLQNLAPSSPPTLSNPHLSTLPKKK